MPTRFPLCQRLEKYIWSVIKTDADVFVRNIAFMCLHVHVDLIQPWAARNNKRCCCLLLTITREKRNGKQQAPRCCCGRPCRGPCRHAASWLSVPASLWLAALSWCSRPLSPLCPSRDSRLCSASLLHMQQSFFIFTPTINTHTHTHIRLTALCPGLPGWTGTRKVKPIWILVKQETVSGNGISWAVCKSAPRSRQITTPALHRSVFYRLDALPAAQPTASKHCRQR